MGIVELRSRRALAGLALLAAAACQEVAEPGRPTSVVLSTDRSTAAVADPVDFRYEARGRTLVGLVVDYGDGARDSVAMHGAQTAAGTVTHAFDLQGTFEVTAALHEFSGETARDTVTVVITGATQDH